MLPFVSGSMSFNAWHLRYILIHNFNSSLCDGVVLETYLDHKFQWPQAGLNRESLAYEVVT